jgi:uncharacterized protein YoxC
MLEFSPGFSRPRPARGLFKIKGVKAFAFVKQKGYHNIKEIIGKGGVSLPEWMGLILVAVAVLLAFFLIRVLIQLNKLTRDVDGLLKKMEQELIPLVHNLKETSENVNRITVQVQDRVQQTEALFKALKDTAQVVFTINRVLKGGVSSTLLNMAGLAAGVKAGSQVLMRNIKKGGK